MTQTHRVAVICAHNPKNSGMYCVDSSAQAYFNSRGIPHDLIVTQGRAHIGGLQYRRLSTPADFAPYQSVVYWGDFLTNPLWGQRDYLTRRSTHGSPSTVEEWLTLYLRLKQFNPHQRIIVAGGCALGGNAHCNSPVIREAYQQFLLDADALILRDPGSVEEVKSIQPHATPRLGFDCAALLGTPERHRKSPIRYFVYAFQRTLSPNDAERVVRETELLTGMKGIEVGWLRNRWPRKFFHIRLAAQLALIARAQFCITDIYHLNICAMGRGTPAICIADPLGPVTSTLNESKKHLLYNMLRLPQHLIIWNSDWDKSLSAAIDALQLDAPSPPAWARSFLSQKQCLLHQLDQIFVTPARSG